jgi:2,4-dienoyl-CoA reductase-like NADH-dependent reductase (Old Yellow Enzyme family)
VLFRSPGFQVPFSEEIRKTGILTGAVGFIISPGQAESILLEGRADLILLGRELLRNPYFVLNAAKELSDSTNWPEQYLRAK